MVCAAALLAAGWAAFFPAARADLLEYVQKPEPAFAWKLKEKSDHPLGVIYDLHLVSQTWQRIPWEHQLQVYLPKEAVPSSTMLLWNTGGSASPGSKLLGMQLARMVKIPVAFLYHVPNQPLLDGKREDALIAETFVRYLKTKDPAWPLLFPMVKSVIKAMDALQEFAVKEWKTEVKKFIIAGASKRGWTSWLTAATGDPRVQAIVPLVIDTLNMKTQLEHQKASFGAYSEMIADYTRAGLVPMPDTPEARKLWSMVDPYFYRDKITVPVLIVNGNNDPYWTTDALNIYWNELKAPKWIVYVPNAGHNLQQRKPEGGVDMTRSIHAVVAFVRHQVLNNPMPVLSWKHEDEGGQFRLTATSSEPPKAARLWVATADTRDFRKALWHEQPVKLAGKSLEGSVAPPQEGCLAFYAELEYELEGVTYYLSTQLRIVGTPRK